MYRRRLTFLQSLPSPPMTLDLQRQLSVLLQKQTCGYIAQIDKIVKPSSYGLRRGELFEEMVAALLTQIGVVSKQYSANAKPGEQFPDNKSKSKNLGFKGAKAFIKGYQRDLWIVGGTSGTRYPVEVKERRHHRGESIFSYPTILVGKTENWDLKNELAASKPGYKGVLGIVIVCGHTGEIRVTSSSLENQKYWKPVYKGKELSYEVPTNRFVSFANFAEQMRLK